jgi:hypothetical protein
MYICLYVYMLTLHPIYGVNILYVICIGSTELIQERDKEKLANSVLKYQVKNILQGTYRAIRV